MKLEKWSVITKNPDPYKAPEIQGSHLHGAIFGSAVFSDGKIITTSRIVGIDEELIITRSGSRYELGEIDPEYEKLYSDARNRLFMSLKGKNNNG